MINNLKIQTAFNELVGYKEEEEQELTLGRQSSGLLVIGQVYKIYTYITGDNFLNVGASSNATGVVFTATGTTPTTWTQLSVLQNQHLLTSDSNLFVNDLSGVDLISIDRAQWIYSDLSHKTITDYLNGIYESIVLSMVYNTLNKLQADLNNTELKKDSYFVKTAPYELATQLGKFVGYRIKLNDSNSLRIILKSIAFQINKAQTIKLFLYELNSKAPIMTYDYTVATDRARVYDSNFVEQILKFTDEISSGNTYILGYFESISTNVQTWMLDSDSEAYNSLFQWHQFKDIAEVMPVELDIDNFTWSGTTYNLNELYEDSYYFSSYYNKGLCVKYQIDCEYTYLICNNINLFAKVLQFELALKIISDALHSKTFNQVTESNRKEWESIKLYLSNELTGYTFEYKAGKGYHKGLYDILLDNLSDIDCECFRSKPLKFM